LPRRRRRRRRRRMDQEIEFAGDIRPLFSDRDVISIFSPSTCRPTTTFAQPRS
jgi:hypothetical protein